METSEQIKVKFVLASVLRLRLRQSEIELALPAGSTLRRAMEIMASRYGSDIGELIFDSDGNVKLRCIVNKRPSQLDDILTDRSEIMILPQLGGG